MSAEQLPLHSLNPISYTEYAEGVFTDELVRMQNSDNWQYETICINGSFQELCAKSLIDHLRSKPHLQKFGGKTIHVVMLPTSEPYMYNIGIQVE